MDINKFHFEPLFSGTPINFEKTQETLNLKKTVGSISIQTQFESTGIEEKPSGIMFVHKFCQSLKCELPQETITKKIEETKSRIRYFLKSKK